MALFTLNPSNLFSKFIHSEVTSISALGHSTESPLSVAQALVRHPQLRRGGTAGLREGALQARQVLRGPGANRQAL